MPAHMPVWKPACAHEYVKECARQIYTPHKHTQTHTHNPHAINKDKLNRQASKAIHNQPANQIASKRANKPIIIHTHTYIHAYGTTYTHTQQNITIYILHCIAYLHTYQQYIAYIHTYTYTHTYIQTYIHTSVHTLHYITLHYITLHYITLHTYIPTYIHTPHTYITLYYITLHYITLHTYIPTYIHTPHTYITLYYITLHYIRSHHITYMHQCMHT